MSSVVGDRPAIASRAASTPPPGPAGNESRIQPGAPPLGIGLVAVFNALLRRWRAMIVIPAVVVLAAVVIALTLSPTFRATAIFAPEEDGESRLPAGLAGMAGQLGVTLGGGSRSADFYAEVAKSRDILRPLLLTRLPDYRTESVTGDSATLLAQLEVAADSAGQVERGIEALGRMMALDVDQPTNLVRVTVTSRYPGLAADVANGVVQLVDEFNTTSRQSQARRRREFVEARVAEAALELRAAEAQLDDFHLRNRAWQQSPLLGTQEARIRRRVELQQETFLTLSRNLEQARIAEVNDAPVISVIQHAVAPRYRAAPRRTVIVLLSAVLGVALAVAWVLVADAAEALRTTQSPAYRELCARLGAWGLLRRSRTGRASGDAGAARD
jgi:uncharacterized protein involved in exopolysaccharide biosynthesis